MKKAFGVIQKISGKVTVNGAKAHQGDAVARGDVVRTGKHSNAWVILENSAVFMMKPLTEVIVTRAMAGAKELEPGAELALNTGGVLSYVHKAGEGGYPFEVKASTVTAGVRGTTFYVEVYDAHKSYVCDCFGNVGLTSLIAPAVVKDVKSVYHTAFFIGDQGAKEDELMTHAGMLGHTDDDIEKMKSIFADATGLTPLPEIRPYEKKHQKWAPENDSGY